MGRVGGAAEGGWRETCVCVSRDGPRREGGESEVLCLCARALVWVLVWPSGPAGESERPGPGPGWRRGVRPGGSGSVSCVSLRGCR